MSVLEELKKAMLEVEEYGQHQGYWYCISDVLTIMVCGLLCNLRTIDDIHEWSQSNPTRTFLEEQFRIKKLPCRAQFYNILGAVDSGQFNQSFIKWMQIVLSCGTSGKTIAIDGKTICSTDKLTPDGSVLHLAGAIISQYGLVIGTHECVTKTGEITAFLELIDMLDVSGAVVVADVLHCNSKSAEAVVQAGADYLFSVKDNVPNLKEDIALYVHHEEMEKHSKIEKNGGRIEKRTAYVTREIDWLYNRENRKGAACVGAIHTEFEKDAKKSSEWHYYISGASLTAEE